jgi:lysophospholipase L1-like esterase
VSARVVVGLVAAAAVAVAVIGWREPESWPIRNARPHDGAIVCFGDSLTYGYGAKPAESYPAGRASSVARS